MTEQADAPDRVAIWLRPSRTPSRERRSSTPRMSGLERIPQGITSLEELLRETVRWRMGRSDAFDEPR